MISVEEARAITDSAVVKRKLEAREKLQGMLPAFEALLIQEANDCRSNFVYRVQDVTILHELCEYLRERGFVCSYQLTGWIRVSWSKEEV